MIMSLKEKKRKFKPRVKLTPNIDIQICVTLSLSFVFRCEDERFEVCLEFINL